MNLQWFPGHMAKTRRMISDNLKLVDVMVELLDARLPLSSRNPEIDKIAANKPRVLALNKSDIADTDVTEQWERYFRQNGFSVVSVDSQSGKGYSSVGPAIDSVMKDIFERDRSKGIKKHSVKLMVVGIPNVGKSSFINRIAGRSAAKTGDRPGITTAKQWIRISNKYELLDTPGILWPKFEDSNVAKRIAFTGGIRDEIIDTEELACELIEYLKANYPKELMERFKLPDDISEQSSYELLELIGRKRGCVISGGNIDTIRAAAVVLDDFRAAKIGRISLEKPC